MGFMRWLRERFGGSDEPAVDEDDADIENSDDSRELPPRPPTPTEAIGFPRLSALGESSAFAFGNVDEGTVDDDRFFVEITKVSSLDLPIDIQRRAQRLSVLEYRKNVRAKRIIDLVVDHAIGDGIRFQAPDAKVQAILQEHWMLNEWDDRSPERLKSLALFGEALWPGFIGENGMVKIAAANPFSIKRLIRNPEDAEDLVAVRVRGRKSRDTTFKLARREKGGEFVIPDGEKRTAFYFAVNRIAGGGRGVPDLLSVIDWIEGLDNYLFSVLERAETSSRVVYDITYEGSTAKEIGTHIKHFEQRLKSGAIYGHNEKVTLELKEPKLGASDVKEVTSQLVKQIQAGSGLAGLFYGDSEDLTRASASELSVPVAKMIQSRQSMFKRMLATVFRFQIAVAKKAGRLEGVTDFSFDIILPPVFLRDRNQITSSLAALSGSLETALFNGLVTREEAATIYKSELEQLGPLTTAPATERPRPGEREEEDEVAEIYDRIRRNGSGDGAALAPQGAGSRGE